MSSSYSTELNSMYGITFEDKQKSWNTPEDVADVVRALDEKEIVHYLKLEGNTLGPDAAAAIGKALEKHPEFRNALWKNMFTSRLKDEIPLALQHLGAGLMKAEAQLTVLDLSDNALGPNGMVGLEDLLRSPTCYTLEKLYLNNCGLGIGGGKMLSDALLDCYASSTSAGTPLKLKVFIAGRNRLENEGAKSISKIFSTLKTLEEIAMPQNSIYHVGIASLAESFKENKNLKVINLNDNTVTHKGAATLADAFTHLPNLVELNFGDCLLKTNGAYHFAEALEQNHENLEIVDLGFNEIGADGGLVFTTALKNKPKLKKLYLDGNNFGHEGCENIRELMISADNVDALGEFEEDNGEDETDDDDDDGNDDENEDDDDDEYEGIHQDDTTEEADEYDYYQDENEETAYTTSPAFTTKMLNENESFASTFSTQINDIKTLTIESFCLSQNPWSLKDFDSLKEENILEACEKVFNQFTGDNRLLLLIFAALKCSHLSKLSKTALVLAISLFEEIINYAVKEKQERRILNYLLIHLGLLRTEEKIKSAFDQQACRYAMREALKEGKINSEQIKSSLNTFLNEIQD